MPRSKEADRIYHHERYHADIEASRAKRRADYAANSEKYKQAKRDERAKNGAKINARRRANYALVKDERNAKRRADYAALPKEKKDKLQAECRTYGQKNKEKISKQKSQYFKANKKTIAVRQQKWNEKQYANTPFKVRAKQMRNSIYCAGRKGIPVDTKYYTVKRLYDMIESTPHCPYCGQKFIVRDVKLTPSIDKVIVSRGYIRGNVDIICRECNRKKADATAAEHRAYADRMDMVTRRLNSVKPPPPNP